MEQRLSTLQQSGALLAPLAMVPLPIAKGWIGWIAFIPRRNRQPRCGKILASLWRAQGLPMVTVRILAGLEKLLEQQVSTPVARLTGCFLLTRTKRPGAPDRFVAP